MATGLLEALGLPKSGAPLKVHRELCRKEAAQFQAGLGDAEVMVACTQEAALARAREARQRVVAGADFATVAREFSDDPTTRDKGGALPFVTAKSLAPEYARAVFSLTRVGEISEPIRAPKAWHVVRLEERRPERQQTFEEARDTIMKQLKERYVAEQRELRLQAIHRDPDLQINQPAIDALVNRVDATRMKSPRSRDKSPERVPK